MGRKRCLSAVLRLSQMLPHHWFLRKLSGKLSDFRGGRSYYLLRNGCVREKKELPRDLKPWEKNQEVCTLESGTRVYVDRVVGNRARISKPVQGWISTVTARGDLLAQW